MGDATIHFDPEKADLLRRPLFHECWRAADDLSHAADAVTWERDEQAEREEMDALVRVGQRMSLVVGLLDQLGWRVRTKGKVGELTADADWLHEVCLSGRMDFTTDLEEKSTTEYLRTTLEASEFYDGLFEQLPERENVEAVS